MNTPKFEFNPELLARIRSLDKKVKTGAVRSATAQFEANQLFIQCFQKYQTDPLLFVRTFFPQVTFLEDFQIELLTMIRNELFLGEERYFKYAASTAKGVGKTLCVSMIMAWALFCFEEPNISVTAPTIYTVKNVTIKTFVNLLMKSELKYFIEPQSEKVLIRPFGKKALIYSMQYIEIITASKKGVSSAQGRHGIFNLSVVDEACGVSEQIIQALKGAETTGKGCLLLVGNPTEKTVSYFENVITGKLHGWVRRTVSALQMKRPDYNLEKLLEQYPNKGTEEYIRFVLGEFPDRNMVSGFFTSETLYKILIKSRDISDFVGRVPLTQGTVIGVDIAYGIGKDHTCAFARRGMEMELILYSSTVIMSELVEKIKYWKSRGCIVAIDASGLGTGIIAEMRDFPDALEKIWTHNKPTDANKDTYLTRGAELADAFNKWMAIPEALIFIPRHLDPLNRVITDMYNQACSFSRGVHNGKMKCIKARGDSPDLIDAATYTFPQGIGTDTYYKSLMNPVPVPTRQNIQSIERILKAQKML